MFTPEEIKSIKDKRAQRSGGGIWKMVRDKLTNARSIINHSHFSFQSKSET